MNNDGNQVNTISEFPTGQSGRLDGNQESLDEHIIENGTFSDRKIRATKETQLYPQIFNRSEENSHTLEKGEIVTAIRETKNYVQVTVNSHKLWGSKANFSLSLEKPTSKTDNENIPVYEFKKVRYDVGVKRKPDIFEKKIFRLNKGDEVLVISIVPESIFVKISIEDKEYYIMENAVKLDLE